MLLWQHFRHPCPLLQQQHHHHLICFPHQVMIEIYHIQTFVTNLIFLRIFPNRDFKAFCIF